jgi:hypothetical protein
MLINNGGGKEKYGGHVNFIIFRSLISMFYLLNSTIPNC